MFGSYKELSIIKLLQASNLKCRKYSIVVYYSFKKQYALYFQFREKNYKQKTKLITKNINDDPYFDI